MSKIAVVLSNRRIDRVGRIVIPKEITRRLGLAPGDEIRFHALHDAEDRPGLYFISFTIEMQPVRTQKADPEKETERGK
jgi:AbrB family looped-hinge helix DNA binding protein